MIFLLLRLPLRWLRSGQSLRRLRRLRRPRLGLGLLHMDWTYPGLLVLKPQSSQLIYQPPLAKR